MFNLTVICCNALIFQKVSDFRLHWHLMIANTKKTKSCNVRHFMGQNAIVWLVMNIPAALNNDVCQITTIEGILKIPCEKKIFLYLFIGNTKFPNDKNDSVMGRINNPI